jgi:hypothetical protein
MKRNRDNDLLAPGFGLPQDKPPDRRRARRRTVFLRAIIYPIDVFCDARICDVSSAGVRGEADVELAIGQIMHITTDEMTYNAGTVKWVDGRQFGLALPNALSLFGIETSDVDIGSFEGPDLRAPRFNINATARLLAGRPPRPATIRNLSSTGMLLDISPGLRPGQHIIVKAGKTAPNYGRVQWVTDGKIGFRAKNTPSVLTFTCLDD